jgi:hypothetical protein
LRRALRPPLAVALGPAAFALGVFALAVLRPARARADDYVTVRGAYYREPSTRVIQPTVEVERDSPTGWDVKAHFLVDSITSASVSAGTSTDSIFTETRNEAALTIRKRWDRSEISAGYKYSAESDYWSHALGVSASRRFWGDTARVGVSAGFNLDTVGSRVRTPECAKPPSTTCSLDGIFGGLTYTQILSPVALAQVSAETSYLDGFQANLYRMVASYGYEKIPGKRLRNALAARVAYYIPRASLALRLQYRYYFDVSPGDLGAGDPWQIQSHMVEVRAYRPLTHDLSVRLSYRQYLQSKASFWCDVAVDAGCYIGSRYYATDPKLGPVHTEYPEVELFWQAGSLLDVPVLGWLAAGTFQISYGHYFQNTSFGNAHVLQAGYTLPY